MGRRLRHGRGRLRDELAVAVDASTAKFDPPELLALQLGWQSEYQPRFEWRRQRQ